MYMSEELDMACFEEFDGTIHEMMKLSQWADDAEKMKEAGLMAGHFHLMLKEYSTCVRIRDNADESVQAVQAIDQVHKLLSALGAWAGAADNASMVLFNLEELAIRNTSMIATTLKGMIEGAVAASESATLDALISETNMFENELERFSNDSNSEEATKLKKAHDALAIMVDKATAELSRCLDCQDNVLS